MIDRKMKSWNICSMNAKAMSMHVAQCVFVGVISGIRLRLCECIRTSVRFCGPKFC